MVYRKCLLEPDCLLYFVCRTRHGLWGEWPKEVWLYWKTPLSTFFFLLSQEKKNQPLSGEGISWCWNFSFATCTNVSQQLCAKDVSMICSVTLTEGFISCCRKAELKLKYYCHRETREIQDFCKRTWMKHVLLDWCRVSQQMGSATILWGTESSQ